MPPTTTYKQLSIAAMLATTVVIAISSLVNVSSLATAAKHQPDQAFPPSITTAEDYIQRGQTRQANAILQAALKNPSASHLNTASTIRAHQLLAIIDRQNQQFDGAENHLVKALKLNPNSATTVIELASTFAEQANNPYLKQRHQTARYRADELFTQAKGLITTPAEQTLWNTRYTVFTNGKSSNSQLGNQKHAQSIPQQNQANTVDDTISQPLFNELSSLIHDSQTSTHTLQSTIYPALLYQLDLNPNHAGYLGLLSEYFARQNQPAQAITYGLAALQQRENAWPAMQTHVAQQYQTIGDTVNAIRFYEAVLQSSPDHEPTLLALAKLSQGQGNQAVADNYFSQAIQQNPTILSGMLIKAQNALRDENTQLAGRQFEQALYLSHPRYPVITAEALHGLTNTLLTDYYYQQPPPALSPLAQQLLQQPQLVAKGSHPSQHGLIMMDGLKIQWAKSGGFQKLADPATSGTAIMVPASLLSHPDPMIRGESLLLAGQLIAANQAFDEADGQTPEGYLALGDRLLALHALNAASIMYQRGSQMVGAPETLTRLSTGQSLITEKRRLADQRLEDGNANYTNKAFDTALKFYRDAAMLYPDWDVPYLRMGDTYLAQKDKLNAYAAYKKAVTINPAYLDGKQFSKTYKKLEKRHIKYQGST